VDENEVNISQEEKDMSKCNRENKEKYDK